MNRLHVIIPAGGVGSRLWPLSRKDRPKFLLDLRMSGKSLLQETIDRLAPIAASFTIVTGRAHEQAVRAQIPQGLDVTVLVEPQGRDSMPAIGLAAYVIRQRFGDEAPIASFAADHAITHPQVLLDCVERALEVAQKGYVVTIGLRPMATLRRENPLKRSLPKRDLSCALSLRNRMKRPRSITVNRATCGTLECSS